jgi:hypothetical protein
MSPFIQDVMLDEAKHLGSLETVLTIDRDPSVRFLTMTPGRQTKKPLVPVRDERLQALPRYHPG